MRNLPLRPLGFGEILDGAFQIYRRDFALYYLIALLAYSPWYLLGHIFRVEADFDPSALVEANSEDPEALWEAMDALANAAAPDMALSMALALAGLAFALVGSLALTAAMARRLDGRPASLGRSYGLALRRLPRALGAFIVSVFIFVVVVVLAGMLGGLFAVVIGLALGPLAAALLSVLVWLAGMAVSAAWLGAVFGILPAVVVEGRKAMSALARSFRLWRGAWLRVFGVLAVASIISVVPWVGVLALGLMWGFFMPPEAGGVLTSVVDWLVSAGGLVVSPLTLPFAIAAVMVLFHDRRVRTEAYDLETLAGAMDAS